eukprot:2143131-Prymnesium_polylepis.1
MMQSQDTKFETIATGLEVPTKEDAPVQSAHVKLVSRTPRTALACRARGRLRTPPPSLCAAVPRLGRSAATAVYWSERREGHQ